MSTEFDEKLDALHMAVVDDLLAKVNSGEATAPELKAALDVLKYNAHSMDIGMNPAAQGLLDSLKEFDTSNFPH